MKPDAYYGKTAELYDVARAIKPKWKNEIAALADFLDAGPVLDVPVGTGRFIPVYRTKGLSFTGIDISQDMLSIARMKYGDINVHRGSAFDLSFANESFATAVCVRFLEWLTLDRASVVIDRLRKVAATLIFTINHGPEGRPDAYTYDLAKFLRKIDGLLIEKRRITAIANGIVSEMFKLRPAAWSDVVKQFAHDHGDEVEANIQRIADKHAAMLGLSPMKVCDQTVRVRAEYWDGKRIGSVVASLADHGFIVGAQARNLDVPVTILDRGAKLILDGRHRANSWMRQKGPHPVLVLTPC